MPAYSHGKDNYWYVKACGGEKKGMHGALQKATFPWSSHSFPIFNAKIQDLPSLWAYKPIAFFT